MTARDRTTVNGFLIAVTKWGLYYNSILYYTLFSPASEVYIPKTEQSMILPGFEKG